MKLSAMSHTRAIPSTPIGAEARGNLENSMGNKNAFMMLRNVDLLGIKHNWGISVSAIDAPYPKGSICKAPSGKKDAASFRTIHPQSFADRCGLFAAVGEGQGRVQKVLP